jgi:hypothetical protein
VCGFLQGKPHKVRQRHQPQQETRGSEVEGPTVLYAAFYANVNGPDYPSFASWNIQPSGKLELRANLLTKAPTGLRATPGKEMDYVIVAP